ncbi:polyprotein of EF-Ts, chloroplastic [Benincasa hispida]|uniref:polyprotein of EF-Ts, chloroplastic n=1 Tax=Benincasa hispida TaxID=102211 RepID=UPI0018FF13E5|nr:polyprotein of EF-Ts, chloroplastic [Benincasa hispida]XP_038878598.1 polyprotein of EF-Ts, chloroplastic [Benincasa hispida]
MSVISPSSISNVSLVPIANHTGKTNSSTRFSFSRKPTKHTLHNQRFLLPLSTSVRLFPNCSKNLFCNRGRRIPIFSASGTDVAVEESDSPVSGEESSPNPELSSGAVATSEKSPVKSDAAPTQSKRPRPVRKSEMPAVNNEELIPGATFTGKVRSIQPFGAFVDFGAFTDGLVHVSRLSDSFVKDVASVVSVGQEVKVRLIEANAETGRISLSMRENDERKESPPSNDKPGSGRKNAPKARGPRRDEVKKSSKFVKGQDLQGTVKNITRSGAFISLPEGEEGFLPSSEESFEGFGNLMGGSTLEIGQEVDVRVLRIARGQVTLTMKKDEDNEKSDCQLDQGKVYAATNPFLLAFRKNKDIATFLDERGKVEEAAKQSVVQKVTEIVEGIVDTDHTRADDKEEESLPSVVDEVVKDDEPASSADSSAVTQDDSESILSTSEDIAVDGVVDAEDKEAEGSSEAKASDDKYEVLDDSSSDVLVTQDEGESSLSSSDNIVDGVTDTDEKEAGESSEVKPSEDEQSEEVHVVEAAQPIDGPETDGKVVAPDDEANKLVSSESQVSEELVASEDSVFTENESEQSQKDLENEIVSASPSEKEEDKPESDSNGSITSLGQSSEEVAESQVDIQAPAENPEVLSSTPVVEEKIEAAPENSADPPEEVAPKAVISPALVKQLRDETGAGMMDCKKALAESGGDIAKAQEFLRKKGLASAEKKASRATAEGRIGSYIHDGRIGVLIEVNCETDFVSRGDIFRELVDDLAMQVAACPQVQYVVTEDVPEEIVNKEREVEMQKEDLLSKPEQIRSRIVEGRIGKRLEELALLEQPYIKNDKVVLKDWVKQTIATIGENIKVKRFVRYNLGEGLEKKSQDFAAEVAAQTAAKPATTPTVKEEQPSVEEAKEAVPKAAAVAVPAALVKKLREETGAGMMDCKKALSETGGDLEKAQEYLRKKGLSSADKKSSRLAAEGRIGSYIHDSRIGVLIEVNCETDFVGRNERFKELVNDLAMQVVACPEVKFVSIEDIPESIVEKEREIELQREDLQNKPENIREKIVDGRISKRLGELVLLEQPFIKDDSILVKDLVKQTVASLGENIKVRRFVRFTIGEIVADASEKIEA